MKAACRFANYCCYLALHMHCCWQRARRGGKTHDNGRQVWPLPVAG